MEKPDILRAWRAGSLGGLVVATLAPLIGEPFMDLGRAADMIWMGFGERVFAPTRWSPDRWTSRHALHVQCPFRLDSESAAVATAADIYHSATDPNSLEPFDWGTPGASVFDARVAEFWSRYEPGSLSVTKVRADAVGGLELVLTEGFSVKVFPNRSGIREHWRYLLMPSGPHFVVIPNDAAKEPNSSAN